jgi:hypothetical protein
MNMVLPPWTRGRDQNGGRGVIFMKILDEISRSSDGRALRQGIFDIRERHQVDGRAASTIGGGRVRSSGLSGAVKHPSEAGFKQAESRAEMHHSR